MISHCTAATVAPAANQLKRGGKRGSAPAAAEAHQIFPLPTSIVHEADTGAIPPDGSPPARREADDTAWLRADIAPTATCD